MPTVFNLPPDWPPVETLHTWDSEDLPEAPPGWVFEEKISWVSYLRRHITGWHVAQVMVVCVIIALGSAIGYQLYVRHDRPSGARELAVKLAQTGVLPITRVDDMTADTGGYIGTDGTVGPETPTSKAILSDGMNAVFEFQGGGRGHGILIEQYDSSSAASLEERWLFVYGQALGANPVRCDNTVFVGDWLDLPTSDAQLQAALDRAGVTCRSADGLHATAP